MVRLQHIQSKRLNKICACAHFFQIYAVFRRHSRRTWSALLMSLVSLSSQVRQCKLPAAIDLNLLAKLPHFALLFCICLFLFVSQVACCVCLFVFVLVCFLVCMFVCLSVYWQAGWLVIMIYFHKIIQTVICTSVQSLRWA